MAPSVVALFDTEKLQGNLAALIDALIKVNLLPARVLLEEGCRLVNDGCGRSR
jgi:hypothetical protein